MESAELRKIQRAAKLDAIQAASRHAFPTADIDQMLAEIARGRAEDGVIPP